MGLVGIAFAIAETKLPVAAGPVFLPFPRHTRNKVEPLQPAPLFRLLFQGFEVEFSVRIMSDNRIWRPAHPDPPRQCARIDAGKPDLSVGYAPFYKLVLRAEARMRRDLLPHHQPHRAQPTALVIFLVRADIADMREGERHDLAVVGRIGHHFLIPGHRGVEADFAHCVTAGAEALAPDYGAVAKDEDSGRAFGLRVRRCGQGHGRSG